MFDRLIVSQIKKDSVNNIIADTIIFLDTLNFSVFPFAEIFLRIPTKSIKGELTVQNTNKRVVKAEIMLAIVKYSLVLTAVKSLFPK